MGAGRTLTQMVKAAGLPGASDAVDPVSHVDNPARLLGKLRWANVSEAERREWSKAAHAKRWGRRRKRLHAKAKGRAK